MQIRTIDTRLFKRLPYQLSYRSIHCSGGGTRTRVIQLMRLSWNLLQSTPQYIFLEEIVDSNHIYLLTRNTLCPVISRHFFVLCCPRGIRTSVARVSVKVKRTNRLYERTISLLILKDSNFPCQIQNLMY